MNEIITKKNYPIQNKWLLKYILGPLGGLVFFLILISFLSPSAEGSIGSIYFLVIFIYFPIVFLFTIVPAVLQRKMFHYSLEEKLLTIEQGVISKKQRHIPYGVIQNIFVKQDLLDRLLGLASLAIENAAVGAGAQVVSFGGIWSTFLQSQQQRGREVIGSTGNKVNIPGLSTQDAETLKQIILQKMKENPIEDSLSGL